VSQGVGGRRPGTIGQGIGIANRTRADYSPRLGLATVVSPAPGLASSPPGS
jgi:hypothetical protein